MMNSVKRASIDLGTNTCLLLIAEVTPEVLGSSRGAEVRPIEDHSTIVRLGQDVAKNRVLATEAKQRTLACLQKYRDRVIANGVDPAAVRCVGTSQARLAGDADAFFAQVRQDLGFDFQAISGEREGELTFRGSLLDGQSPEQVGVVDLGGGSTEFTSQNGAFSFELGSVRITEQYLRPMFDLAAQPITPEALANYVVTDAQFWAAQDAVDLILSAGAAEATARLGCAPLDLDWVAVAGTAVTLAQWHLGLPKFDRSQLDGTVLTRGDLHRMTEELKWRSISERMQLPGVDAGRADVLLAGALILWRACEIFKLPKLTVSTRGLRYGLVL